MGPELKVSVIIPAYNAEKTLSLCLNSVLNQTYKNYEVIVVDNNSTDRTKEIICNLKEKNGRIKYVFAEIRSTSVARNTGIIAAGGDIFVFTDADCICPSNWLVEITRPIRIDGEDATVGFEEDLIKNYWTKHIQKVDEIYMQRCAYGKYTTTLDTKNCAIKAKMARELMFDPDINVLDDIDLAVRITARAKICYLASVRVGHFHRSSLRGTIKTNFLRGFWCFRIYRKYKKLHYARKYIMFESMHLKNWMVFPFWLVFQFIKKPIGEACFIFITELSWRAGLLWSIIKR